MLDGGTPDEAALLTALRAGDDTAFATLVDRLGPGLLRLARSYVRSDAVAGEVVQDTWLAALEGLDRFEGRSSVRTWLYRILINIARTRAAREARSVPYDPTAPTVDPGRFEAGLWSDPPRPWDNLPESRLLAAETLAGIARAIERLPERQRRVILLRDVDGLAADDVAELLDITTGNARVLLHRARAAVREQLEEVLS